MTPTSQVDDLSGDIFRVRPETKPVARIFAEFWLRQHPDQLPAHS